MTQPATLNGQVIGQARARYQRIIDGIAEITQRLYHDLPHDDLVVARRVLETLTERARAELANAS